MKCGHRFWDELGARERPWTSLYTSTRGFIPVWDLVNLIDSLSSSRIVLGIRSSKILEIGSTLSLFSSSGEFLRVVYSLRAVSVAGLVGELYFFVFIN